MCVFVVYPGQALYLGCQWECHKTSTGGKSLSNSYTGETKVYRIYHVSIHIKQYSQNRWQSLSFLEYCSKGFKY